MDARRLGMGIALPQVFLGKPGRARVPDRRRMGCPGRGLAGAGPVPIRLSPPKASAVRWPASVRARADPAQPAPALGVAVGRWLTAQASTPGRAAVPACGLPGPTRPSPPEESDPPDSLLGQQQPVTPSQTIRSRSVTPLVLAACTGTPPSSTRMLPPASPSTTCPPWAACSAACGRRARGGRSQRWPSAPPSGVPLSDPAGLARPPSSLQWAGARKQVTALLARDPAAGRFPERPVRCDPAAG